MANYQALYISSGRQTQAAASDFLITGGLKSPDGSDSITTADGALTLTDAVTFTGGITTANAIAGATTINASGTITGGTLTDGTFSVSSGAVTGVTTLGMGGALSGVTTIGASGVVTFTDTTDASSSTTGALKVAGGLGVAKKLFVGTDLDVSGNAVIDGNLTVSGDTITVNTATLTVEDPLIELGSGNAGNTVDLGLYANYNDGAGKFAGFLRDATDGVWKLFDSLTTEPTTTATVGSNGWDTADLQLGALTSDDGVTISAGGLDINGGGIDIAAGGMTNVGAVSGVTTLGMGGALSGVTTLACSDTVTLSEAAANITHSGATSLTIASTSGFVAVESIQFAGANIGIAADTDLLALASADLTVNGATTVTGAFDVNGNLTVSTAGAVSGATSIDGSGDLTMDTITMTSFTVDTSGNTDVLSLDVGGGYGSTGVSISAAGVIQANGALTVDGAATLTSGFDANAASTVSTLTIDGADGSRDLILTSNTSDPDDAVSLYVLNGELWYRETVSGGTNLATQITDGGSLNMGEIGVTMDAAYNGGRTITCDAGPVVFDHSTTSGILELQPGLAAETSAALDITFTAVAYTGTPHGITIDYGTATSVTNGSNVYGVELLGASNAGAGDLVGLYLDSNWDTALSCAGLASFTNSIDAFASLGVLSADESTYGTSFTMAATESSGAGTHARISTVEIDGPTVTDGTGATTATAGLYIADAGSGGASNYALWVDAGQSLFDGNVDCGSGLDVSGAALTVANQAITQTTGGQVTFAGNLDANGGIDCVGAFNVDTGAASLTCNGASDFTTSSGALTITAAAASTWSTSAGGLTLTSADAAKWSTASNALEIEGATTLTLDGGTGVNIQEGGANVIAIDTNRDVLFGQTGGSTSDPDVEIDGYFRCDGAAEFDSTAQFDGTVTFNDDNQVIDGKLLSFGTGSDCDFNYTDVNSRDRLVLTLDADSNYGAAANAPSNFQMVVNGTILAAESSGTPNQVDPGVLMYLDSAGKWNVCAEATGSGAEAHVMGVSTETVNTTSDASAEIALVPGSCVAQLRSGEAIAVGDELFLGSNGEAYNNAGSATVAKIGYALTAAVGADTLFSALIRVEPIVVL